MSTLLAAPTLFEAVGGEPTLDDQLVGAWEGLTAHRAVECVVCGDEMQPVYGTGRRQDHPSGRCAACGSTLA